jgi:hypothetical protein
MNNYPINQTWLLTNKGAVDFLTMSWQWPIIVNQLQRLQARVEELEQQTKNALPQEN